MYTYIKVLWWRTGFANTEGKLGKEPDGEKGSIKKYFKSCCLREQLKLLKQKNVT